MSDAIVPYADKAGRNRYSERGETVDKRFDPGIAGFILILTAVLISAAVISAISNEADAGGDTPIEGTDRILGGTGTFNDPYVVTDDVFWEIKSEFPQDFFHVIISGSATSIGSYAFQNCDSIVEVEIPSSVTSIGDHAFFRCRLLQSVSIPDSVTSIGDYAFCGCSISRVTIPDSVTSIGEGMFEKSALKEVTIPSSVTSIGDYAFSQCSLSRVTIPSSVTSIGKYAFFNCTPLASVTIPNSVTSIGIEAFYGCSSLASVTIPDSVTSIGDSTFMGCSSLASVTIPSSVTSIGEHAFHGCSSLASVTIPSSVTSIGEHAFHGCSLASVTIPDSVTSIGGSAFQNCHHLQSLTIPDSVTSIGDEAFRYCNLLQSVSIPDSVTSIGDKAFWDCTSLRSVSIPSSVTSIGKDAFGDIQFYNGSILLEYSELPGYVYNGPDGKLYRLPEIDSEFVVDDLRFRVTSLEPAEVSVIGCESVPADLTIPAKVSVGPEFAVTSLKYSSFSGQPLQSVIIPSSVTSIGQGAFSDCSALQSVTIPSSVTSIGQRAFSGCTSLKGFSGTYGGIVDGAMIVCESTLVSCAAAIQNASVTIPTSVTSIGEDAFSGCTSLQSVTIPSSVVSIGSLAFVDCTSLRSAVIPSSVVSIGYGAFFNCTSLQSVTIPPSVTSIGYGVFEGCSSLQSVTIPSSVTSIEELAFSGCTSLQSVTIPSSVTSVGEWAFDGVQFYDGSTLLKYSELPGYTYIGSDGKLYRPAESGSVFVADNLKFCVLSAESPESPEVSVEGFDSDPTEADLVIPAEVLYEGVKYAVTSLSYGSFANCKSIRSAFIPSSVTSIGLSAFTGCTSLNGFSGTCSGIVNGVMLANGSTLVSCAAGPQVTSVYIPYTISSIGDYAFYNCSSIQSIFIPSSVDHIGDYPFYNCTSLRSVNIPSTITSVGGFYNCTSLQSVDIPSSVTSIQGWAFYNCTSLRSVTIPSSVTFIGNDAFSGVQFYNGLTPLDYSELPGYTYEGSDGKLYRFDAKVGTLFAEDGLKYRITSAEPMEVSVEGFESAAAETVLVIPAEVSHKGYEFAVASIGKDSFAGCTSLQFVAIPSSITSIGDRAFDGIYFLEGFHQLGYSDLPGYNYEGSDGALKRFHAELGFTFTADGLIFGVSSLDPMEVSLEGCESDPENLVIPAEASYGVMKFAVTSLGESLLKGCNSLQSVDIPSSVTSVRDYAFSGCTSLRSVAIPSSVTSIGWNAFSGCTSLRSADIPSSVTFTGGGAFSGCTSLNGFSGTYEGIVDGIMLLRGSDLISCAAGPQVTSVVVPSSVTLIADGAFENCPLQRIDIPSSVESIGLRSFGSIEFYRGSTLLNNWDLSGHVYEGSNGKLYCLPEPGLVFVEDNLKFRITSVEPAEVSAEGYESSSSETDLAIPAEASYAGVKFAVTSVGDSAFEGCTSLLSVDMLSVKDIGNFAFLGCPLERIYLPHTLGSLGDQAFYGLTFTDDEGGALAHDAGALRGYAYEGVDGVLKRLPYVFAQDGVRCWISAEGSAVAVGWEGEPSSLGIPDEVQYLGRGYAPTKIADGAFSGCDTLESISIGSAVASIGAGALDAPMLSSITVSAENEAYSSIAGVLYDKDAATLLKFPASKQRLAIPDSVTGIADGAFQNAGAALKDAYVEGDEITYFRYVSIPGTVASVGANAFSGSTLEVLKFADGTTAIGSKAFAGCSALDYVVFNGTLADVASDAFEDCVFHGGDGSAMAYSNAAMAYHKFTGDDSKSLKMYVPAKGTIRYGGVDYKIASSGASKTVTVSGLTAGSGVTDLVIPASIGYLGFEWEVTGIAAKAFYGDNTITSVTAAVDVGNKSFANCKSLETVVLDGAKKIGIYAFYGCKSLTVVELGKVTSLGESAFSGCKSLSAVDLDNVTKVGKHAFYGCALAEADLSSAETIGYGAFTGNDLGNVIFSSALKSVDPKAFFRYSFYGADGAKLPVSASGLAGKAFEGSGKVLVQTS